MSMLLATLWAKDDLDAADIGAETAGAAATAQAFARQRSNHTGTQSSSSISDFTEAAQDAVAAMLASGTNITLSYNDAGNALSITAAGGDAEVMRDTIGAAIGAIDGLSVTVNDGADTIVIGITGIAIAKITGLQATLDSHATLIGDFTDALDDGLATKMDSGYAGLPTGTMVAVYKSGTWPARPTSDPDVRVMWVGAAPSPSVVTTPSTSGMYEKDFRAVTA
jgi:YD repeat-containing protein